MNKNEKPWLKIKNQSDTEAEMYISGDIVGDDVGRGDSVGEVLLSRQVDDFFGDPRIDDLPVGRHDEAELVHASMGRQLADKTNIWTLRRFNRTDSTVVRNVNVADFEACTLSVQTARAQCAQSTLVGQLTQGVRLVDYLR